MSAVELKYGRALSASCGIGGIPSWVKINLCVAWELVGAGVSPYLANGKYILTVIGVFFISHM